MVRYIGDVHGKIAQYLGLLDDCENSVQVGDFGAGFVNLPILADQHRFIRGNHDDPAVCRAHSNWIPDLTVEGKTMYIGGAFSIDYRLRTEGVNFWSDEELSYAEFDKAIELYSEVKPDVMVTHDGPSIILCEHIFRVRNIPSRTGTALQNMFDIHRPSVWIHGHWHIDSRKVVLGCDFISLGELSYIDI